MHPTSSECKRHLRFFIPLAQNAPNYFNCTSRAQIALDLLNFFQTAPHESSLHHKLRLPPASSDCK